MKLKKNLKALGLHLALCACLVFFAASVSAQTQAEIDAAAQIVGELFDQKRFAEAAPYLETLVKAKPEDAQLRFLYGFSLLAKSKAIGDTEAAKKLSAQALAEFKKAKQLGLNEPTNDTLIAMLSGDGQGSSSSGGARYSKNPEAEKFMGQAESYFAQSEYDKAFEFYQKALKLDPNIYEAALYSGDVFVQKGKYQEAEIWYQKAIAINPNRETAYRYSATPLMKQKKYDEARDRYVEAYITEPYSELSPRGLTQWAQITGTKLGHPKLNIPASVGAGDKGNVNITLGLGDDTGDGSFAWTAYGLARATWQSGKTGLSDKFKKAYPNEKQYRHSLAEEYDALKTTVTVLKERMQDKKSPVIKLNPQLETLMKIHDEGLLEAYILMALADEGIAQDHPAYLKQNREKLRLYVLKYVIGAGGK